ncbi:MAG: hypothetical protein KTR18_03785, partial [Acidiferrobacterales bacterium]|nr:hypothetical protein [Acidiferrobacterales bacterium]
MKQRNQYKGAWVGSITAALISGCVPLQPPPIPAIPSPPPAPRVVHTVITAEETEGSCGSLHEFVLDVQKLESKARKELLDELSSYEGGKFSCDRLKTGLLLSQIGKTIREDNLAIEILDEYDNADQLHGDNQQL